KVVDNVFLETEFDGDVLAEDKLAIEDILVGEDQIYTRHEVVEFLFDGQSAQGFDGLGVPYQLVYNFFREMTLFCYLKDHLPLNLRKMLISLGELNENVQLFFCNNIHRQVDLGFKTSQLSRFYLISRVEWLN